MVPTSILDLLLRIRVNVIDEHLLWKLGGSVWLARPASADRNVQNNEKRMIEDPLAGCRPLRLGEGGVIVGIDVEPRDARLPLDCVNVKIVGKDLAGGHNVRSGQIGMVSD